MKARAWLFCLLTVALMAQSAPERTVRNNVIVSKSDPAVTLGVTNNLKYAGGQVIDILKVAGAEQHFFIEEGPGKTVRRFLWVQFEHYYPTNQHIYDYSQFKSKPMQLGDLEFQADARVIAKYFVDDNRPGSDSEAAQKFLQAKGYNLDGTFASLRMFYLTDESKRKELMMIYGEVVRPGESDEQATARVIDQAQKSITVRSR
jgi:hypothetical protein